VRAVFGRLAYNSIKDRVAEEVREAILNGALGRGERIVERKLAEQFSTSLTAIREALIELEAEGYVTKRPNRATHVIEFSSSAVDEIFAFRRIVETAAVEEAARVASPEQTQILRDASDKLLEAARAGDPRSYLQKDLLVHEILWKISNNEYLEIALKRVIRPFFAFTVIHVSVPSQLDLVEDAMLHLGFVDPVISRDPKLARKKYLEALEAWHKSAQPPYFDIASGKSEPAQG
jgi:DNA-binding GntR family transcriptional regulator